MADLSTHQPSQGWKIDWAWVSIPAILAVVAILAPAAFPDVFSDALSALIGTAPFILFAISATAYLRAAGAEGIVAKAFTGPQLRMVLFGAMAGGLSPFCSCEVIPFIAALLAMGAPLAAVMAFWIASPLMDPPMFAITAGALGADFAIAKVLAAVGMGLIGGLGVMALTRTPGLSSLVRNPLRESGMMAKSTQCCGPKPDPKPVEKAEGSCCATTVEETPFLAKPVWKFWKEPARVKQFRETAVENGLFLGKWLALAYVLEAIMIRWIPADYIATWLGGEGIGTIFLAAIVGAPAYLNGYAAAPLAAGLIEQGMAPGAAMAFLLAGGVTCIPAAVAVWSLVKTRVFLSYLGFALIGSVFAGLMFGAYAA